MKKIGFAGTLLFSTLVAGGASAYNTGNHTKATEWGLSRVGFSPSAIQAVAVANFQVDYMVNKPTSAQLSPKTTLITKYFHFDDLDTARAIDREFAWMEQGARVAVQRAAARNDPERIVNALGIVLHAVQDFYSHSNFADVDWVPLTGQRVTTWDDVPVDLRFAPLGGAWFTADRAIGEKRGVVGGNAASAHINKTPLSQPGWPGHGDSYVKCDRAQNGVACGLNHDGVPRRGNLTSMLIAARASGQWADKFRGWVNNPALWQRVTSFSGGYVKDCYERMQAAASAANQWGWDASQGGATTALRMLGALASEGCEWDWQDNRWASVLHEMYLETVTERIKIPTFDGQGRPPRIVEYPSDRPEFTMPAPPAPFDPAAFVGSYAVTWGASTGTLQLTRSGDLVQGTLTLAGATLSLVPARPQGSALDLTVQLPAPMDQHQASRPPVTSGRVHLMTKTRDALAGFLRNGDGVPNGFVAQRRPDRGVVLPVRPAVLTR